MSKTQVTVYVADQEFRLNGTESEEYIQQVAAFADQQYKQMQEKYPGLSIDKCLTLTLVNMADELLKLREQYAELDRRIDELCSIPQMASRPASRNTKTVAPVPVKHPFAN